MPDRPETRPTLRPRLRETLDAIHRSDAALAERIVATRTIHGGHYMDLRLDTVERDDGSRHDREIIAHPGAVAILAIDDDDRVLFVRQYRVAADRVLMEIPAGTLDREADGSTENPDLAARRELEEETGYRAASWQRVLSFWTAPGFATEHMHLYVATGLTYAEDHRLSPDEDEALELVRLPVDDAIEAAAGGGFQDAKSILALLWLARARSMGTV